MLMGSSPSIGHAIAMLDCNNSSATSTRAKIERKLKPINNQNLKCTNQIILLLEACPGKGNDQLINKINAPLKGSFTALLSAYRLSIVRK